MQFRKHGPELSLIEAVDNLSHLAELDMIAPQEKNKPGELTEEQISERMLALSWFDPEYYAFNRERIKETFLTLGRYIRDIYEKDKGHLRDLQTQRGIQAIMLMAGEAAQKIDNYTEIFKGEKGVESVTALKEFKELQHFYLTKVVQRFSALNEPKENWEDAWGKGEIVVAPDAPLRDLEMVRRDKEYELFQIRKEDKTPYFNRTLLRHMQLMGQFDGMLKDPTMDDPFLRLEMINDKNAEQAAKQILHLAAPYTDEFFKEALKFKNIGFIASISKCLMALMLAGSSRNLMQNALGKHSLNYYADFHHYLRSALQSKEYLKFVSSPPDLSEAFLHSVVNLSHVLCTSFYLKVGSRKEIIGLIRLLIEKGGKGSVTQSQTSSPNSLWNNLQDKDTSLRSLLKQYPSGPLMKVLKLFEEEGALKGFDPLAQGNQPSQLYTMVSSDLHVSCLRIPAPIFQENIGKAEVVDEFCGFIRAFASVKRNQRHLLFNLQDRTSWNEHARCQAIEQIQKKKDLSSALLVVTLPRNTDFYMQAGTYIEWDDAKEFMKLLKEQVASGAECGFYFPSSIDVKGLVQFSESAIKTIHTVFFGGKDRLEHKNRLDFIEIFYLLLTLKLIENYKPDSLSFSCKDALDTGVVMSVELFAFLRMMNDTEAWSKEEKEFLLWMIYAPALAVRERTIDLLCFNRMLSALCIVHAEIEAHYEQTVAACSKLYKTPFFKGLKIKEAS